MDEIVVINHCSDFPKIQNLINSCYLKIVKQHTSEQSGMLPKQE